MLLNTSHCNFFYLRLLSIYFTEITSFIYNTDIKIFIYLKKYNERINQSNIRNTEYFRYNNMVWESKKQYLNLCICIILKVECNFNTKINVLKNIFDAIYECECEFIYFILFYADKIKLFLKPEESPYLCLS